MRTSTLTGLALTAMLILATGFASTSQTVHHFSIHFDSDADHLSPTAQAALDSAVAQLSNIPQAYEVTITGHTDNQGSADYNRDLSERRARKAHQHFVQAGIPTHHVRGITMCPKQARNDNK